MHAQPRPPLSTTQSASDRVREARGFSRLVVYLRRHKLRATFGLILVPVFTAIQLLVPKVWSDSLRTLEALDPARDAVEAHVGVGDASWWVWRIALISALWLAYSSLRCLARYLQVGLSRRIEEELRDDMFRHLQRLPARFFDEARIGDLVSRSTADIELLRFMAGPTLFFGLQTLIVLPGTLWFLAQISVTLVVTVLVLLTLIGVGMHFAFPKLARTSRVVQDVQADIAAKAQEDFAGIRVLHGFARETDEVKDFAVIADQCREAQVDMARARGLLHASFVAGGQIAPLAIVLVGIAEGMSIPLLFEAFLYMQMLVWPLMVTGWLLQSWHRARAAADRIDEIFDVEPEDDRHLDPIDVDAHPSIEARHLTFSYGDGTHALRDVSFQAAGREMLGIVGPIGSGKSTLLSLLTRLYDPPPNALFVGGIDVTKIPRAHLRSRFAVATQEPFLFSDTLENNVRFGALEEHDSQSTNLPIALDDASLEIDPDVFPNGLEQVVGERGVSLSGGQKQRASLARALLAERDILVLDDTLSAVDSSTEQRILERLKKRAREQTTIVIAHRLDAVRDADRILVLDEGRLIAQGSHDELLSQGGWYAETWEQQQRERV